MSQKEMMEYLRLYAQKFHLEDFVTFDTEVLSVHEDCCCSDSGTALFVTNSLVQWFSNGSHLAH